MGLCVPSRREIVPVGAYVPWSAIRQLDPKPNRERPPR
jgi:hypothetical protein